MISEVAFWRYGRNFSEVDVGMFKHRIGTTFEGWNLDQSSELLTSCQDVNSTEVHTVPYLQETCPTGTAIAKENT